LIASLFGIKMFLLSLLPTFIKIIQGITLSFFHIDLNINYYLPIIIVLGSLILYIYLIKKMILEKGYKISLGLKPKIRSVSFIILLLAGFILVYDNTFQPFISNNIKEFSFIKEIISEQFENPISSFFLIIIIAPIFEEVIFRGVILKQLLKQYSLIISLFISSILFAFIHFNINQGIGAFFWGMIFGFVYYKTESLIIPIILHLINNLFYFFVHYYWTSYDIMSKEINLVQIIIGLFLLGGSYLILNKTKIVKNENYNVIIKDIKT